MAQDGIEPTCFVQCQRHGVVAIERELGSSLLTLIVAIVVFQIIHAPVGKGLGILLFVAQGRRVLSTGIQSSRRIHAKQKTQAVDLVCDSFHPIGELGRVGDKGTIVTSLLVGPAVVKDDILIAQISEAKVHHLVCCI